MYQAFFPNETFGWTFYAVLVGLLAVASWTDFRTFKVPKWLAFTILLSGVAFNVCRGVWLGGLGLPVWLWNEPGAALGGVDGVLFALAGFAVGFGLFFVLWGLGTCGGGDVKLFAALGAWLGPVLAVAVLAGTLVSVTLVALGKFAWRMLNKGVWHTAKTLKARAAQVPDPRHRWTGYSGPVLVATALIVLWVFRVDLHLAAPPKAPNERVQIHVP